jgi:hypothetical protein
MHVNTQIHLSALSHSWRFSTLLQTRDHHAPVMTSAVRHIPPNRRRTTWKHRVQSVALMLYGVTVEHAAISGLFANIKFEFGLIDNNKLTRRSHPTLRATGYWKGMLPAELQASTEQYLRAWLRSQGFRRMALMERAGR